MSAPDDWFEQGLAKLKAEMAEQAECTPEQAQASYSFLSEVGLLDYDVEKEVIWDRYFGDEEEGEEG